MSSSIPSISSSFSSNSSNSYKNSQKISEINKNSFSGSSSPSSSTDGPITLTNNYYLIPREQLIVKEQLGIGTYGAVFKGIWERPDGNNLVVAMKKVFMLEKEVEILSQIRHRNIIQLYGVSQANPDFYIVTEYAEMGSLYEHLHNTNEQLSVERRIKWAKQIARGVAYLHYEAPITVIHRDLKSKNVVIGFGNNQKKLLCKICDFGTSKDLTNSWTAPSWGGTAAWMSPEIISQREGITTATDVWSFAVVLWELFSRQVPYNGLTEFKIYSIISQHGVRLCIPDNCPKPLADLLERCWKQSPKDRPEMRYVLTLLEKLSQDKDLRAECALFVNQSNGEWNKIIKKQLKELDTLKLDLARQIEDLMKREQALRKRENSHRNFLHMVDILNVENVCEWNEDCVCEWVQNIAAAASSDFPESTVDKIISSVLQYGINGPRLMEITEKDLECLGIEPVALRRYIILKLDELRAMNVQLCNYPCSIESPLLNNNSNVSFNISEENNNNNCCLCSNIELKQQNINEEEPLECSILLHVGMYSRTLETKTNIGGKENNNTTISPIYRFKIFLDSDWETPPTNYLSKDDSTQLLCTQESATVIKEVNILMYSADHSIFFGPIQCICPPFGYLEWAQIGRDQQYKKLPLTLTLTVSYTNQVIRPNNTQIQIRLSDLSGGPRTLCLKKVKLFLLPKQTNSSLCRISASLLQKQRRNSIEGGGCENKKKELNISPIRKNTGNLVTSSSSPVWADLAANIRNSKLNKQNIINNNNTITQRSMSYNEEKENNKINKCCCCNKEKNNLIINNEDKEKLNKL
ncbi:hypothetical protein Mgra_00001904 [Meloidogyne graminicola]|uniref:Mitogen-activated protein kinase kinase kinase n=1 Tax=Meloidogyne graminicola TaxID=189291 RepID=A0A8S9ZZ34_9BILA|nr:hypothetical protein Mgra_00001904 [Meloidogyne graminicola]